MFSGRNWHLMSFTSTSQCFSPLSTVLLFPQSTSVFVFYPFFRSQRQPGQQLVLQTNTETKKRVSTAGGAPSSARSPSGASVNGGDPATFPETLGVWAYRASELRVCVCLIFFFLCVLCVFANVCVYVLLHNCVSKCIRVCVCLCAHVCGYTIQLHNLPCSLNHIRFRAENNKTTGWQKSSTAGNRPRVERNTHTHTHMHMHTHSHSPAMVS